MVKRNKRGAGADSSSILFYLVSSRSFDAPLAGETSSMLFTGFGVEMILPSLFAHVLSGGNLRV